jgi:PKHD-type hydroxylase
LHQSTHKQLRKLSVVILLNDKDKYTGGNLELDHLEKPQNFNKAGDAVFFPSSLKHRVTPVETGTRYSLVCWSNGPPWR